MDAGEPDPSGQWVAGPWFTCSRPQGATSASLTSSACWGALDSLLAAARVAGAVLPDVELDEVVALLTAACQGALTAGCTAELRRRTVARMLDGLRA